MLKGAGDFAAGRLTACGGQERFSMLAHGAEQSEAGQWAAHYAKEAALDTVPNPAPPRPAPPRPAPPRPAPPRPAAADVSN